MEAAAIDYKRSGSAEDLIRLFLALENKPGARTFRPEILRTCLQALRSCGPSGKDTFLDAALRIREQSRMLGRRVPPRAVGSPLLLKGLEADVAVILNVNRRRNGTPYRLPKGTPASSCIGSARVGPGLSI